MSHVIRRLTMAFGGLVLAGLPIVGDAQSTSSEQTQPTSTTSEQSRSSAKEPVSPQHHLDQARRVLDTINSNDLKGDAKTQFTELKEHFNLLNSAWQSKVATAARTGAVGGHATGHVGTASGTGSTTSGTPAATAAGTSGTPEQAGATGATARPAPRGDDNIDAHYEAIKRILPRIGDVDADTTRKLTEFRQHLEKFHATARTQGTAREEMSSIAAPTTGVSATVPEPLAPEYASTASTSAGAGNDAIARLNAQVDDLLRSASTPAATGTSGGTATTICVERAKLEALKRDIQTLRRP
jgi:hypothetical protein